MGVVCVDGDVVEWLCGGVVVLVWECVGLVGMVVWCIVVSVCCIGEEY